MGARASKQEIKVDHFLFGKVTLKNQFDKQLITYHQPMLRTDQFNEWEEKYKNAVTMNKQSLLLPQSYDKMKIQKFFMCCECPADTQMALTYEKFDYTLQKELNTRKVENKYFAQEELFFIFFKILEGCKEFQLRKMNVGDIKASKIVKTRKGQLKLINVASYPRQYTPIEKILDYLDNKNTFYLAPEEIRFIKSRGYTQGKFPNAKSEAFSLGLTILECATLTQATDLYQKPPSRQLNKQQLQFRVKSIQDRYPSLVKYLRMILKEKPEDRLSTGEMWACLKPYSSSINQISRFSPKDSAQKTQMNTFRNTLAKRSYN